MAIYTIKSQASGFCLNVNGNTQVSPHRNVNVYRPMGSDDQNWVIGSFSGNQLIKSNISASYALNAYRVGSPWNCDIYPWSGNLNDAEVCFESVSSNVYRIRLAHHAGYYLTAQGAASGSNVVWAAKNGSSIYQQWRVARVSGPTPPPTPSGFVYPSTSRNVTQHYNAYSHPAVDISGAFRSDIYAFADGVVAFRQTQPINWLPDASNPPFGNNSMETMGNCIAINHNNPNTKLYAGSYARTIYMHLEDMRVNPGDMVKKGQLIGSMGTTGRSSGVHLHFCLAVGNLSSMAPGQGGWVSLDLLPKINPAIYLPEWK